MKRLILIPLLLVLSTHSYASVSDMTEKFVEAKEQLATCYTLKSCTTASFEYYAYVNHPDNDKDLDSCEKDGKCYEAMMDLTMYIFADYLTKPMEMDSSSINSQEPSSTKELTPEQLTNREAYIKAHNLIPNTKATITENTIIIYKNQQNPFPDSTTWTKGYHPEYLGFTCSQIGIESIQIRHIKTDKFLAGDSCR